MAKTASAEVSRYHAEDPGRREIITPEGVPLAVDLAGRWERAIALIIDLTIMFLAIAVFALAVMLVSGSLSELGFGLGLVLLISFLVRSFYFVFFELRWQGATPGKRALGLRVIDRAGGRLRADAIFARNLMREVELFLPLSLLFTGGLTGSDAWVMLLTFCWAAILTLMPLFNKDRLRVGDIVGGTWVVNAPKSLLLSDVAEAGATLALGKSFQAAAYSFTEQQLEAYGIYELQTLEKVLRDKGLNASRTRDAVCRQIQQKIGWDQTEPANTDRFLEAYYAALRARLEKKMLLGVRRESKHDPT